MQYGDTRICIPVLSSISKYVAKSTCINDYAIERLYSNAYTSTERERAKKDMEAMREQALNVKAEFDRLLAEHTTLQVVK